MDKKNITLAEIPSLDRIELSPVGTAPIWTTAAELMRDGRFPSFLTLAEVEFALSSTSDKKVAPCGAEKVAAICR